MCLKICSDNVSNCKQDSSKQDNVNKIKYVQTMYSKQDSSKQDTALSKAFRFQKNLEESKSWP